MTATISKWLPWVFFAALSISIFFGIDDILAYASDSRILVPLIANDLAHQIDEFKWVLTIILTTSGLFTLAQVIAAGFNTQSFNKQAERSIKEIEQVAQSAKDTALLSTNELKEQAGQSLKAIEEFAQGARSKADGLFPDMTKMHDARKESLERLKERLRGTKGATDEALNDWERNLYSDMPIAERQELLSIERFLNYEYTKPLESAEHAKTYRRLANFYFTKYRFERLLRAELFSDLERALYLLNLAMKEDKSKTHSLLNDKGNVYTTMFRAYKESRLGEHAKKTAMREALKQALICFNESKEIRSDLQRVHYNLAYIEADLKENGDLRKAIHILAEAELLHLWEDGPSQYSSCALSFNRACYMARLASISAEERFAICSDLIAKLNEVAAVGLLEPDEVEREFSEGGDFDKLIQALHDSENALPEVVDSLNRCKPLLSKNCAA